MGRIVREAFTLLILNVETLRQMFANAKLADVYISHRIHGETFQSIADRYGVDKSTIFDNWVRGCHHVKLELERELARTEYSLTRKRTANTPDGQNRPKILHYTNGHTHKDTFSIPSIRPFVVGHCHGLVLNAFAGNTILAKEGCTFITNDINETCPTDLHLDVSSAGFVGDLQRSAGHETYDTILVDPPFSLYLARRKYNGKWFRDYTLVKNNLDRFARVGTKVLTFGFNSTGFGIRRGYEKEELLIVNTKGNSNDILILVERKVRVVENPTSEYEEINLGYVG